MGFSSFAVGGNSAFTRVGREDEDGLQREVCIALDVKTGKEQWSAWLDRLDYGHGGGNAGASDNKGGDGPRSTPSYSNGRVYALDADFNLYCLDGKTGKANWKKAITTCSLYSFCCAEERR